MIRRRFREGNVSLDAQRRVAPSPGDRECIERDKEIQRLRDELAAAKGEGTNRRGFGWWCLLVFGLCVLALMPHSIFLLAGVLDDVGNHTLAMLAQGVLLGVPVTQYSVVALVTALHWRPGWQRLLCGVAVAGFFGIVSLGPYFSSGDNTRQLIRTLAPLVPIAIVISSCPLLIQRALFRWTIAFHGQSIRPIPVTLSSFLVFIGLCGLAIACLRLTDLSLFDGNSTAELAVIFLLYVGVPATTTGFLFAVFLPTILQRGGRSWTTWVLRLIAVVVVIVSGPAR